MNKEDMRSSQEKMAETIRRNPSEGKTQFSTKAQKELPDDSKLEWVRNECKNLIDASLEQISEKYERAFGVPESIDLNFRDLRIIDSEQYEVTCIICGKGFKGLARFVLYTDRGHMLSAKEKRKTHVRDFDLRCATPKASQESNHFKWLDGFESWATDRAWRNAWQI